MNKLKTKDYLQNYLVSNFEYLWENCHVLNTSLMENSQNLSKKLNINYLVSLVTVFFWRGRKSLCAMLFDLSFFAVFVLYYWGGCIIKAWDCWDHLLLRTLLVSLWANQLALDPCKNLHQTTGWLCSLPSSASIGFGPLRSCPKIYAPSTLFRLFRLNTGQRCYS